MSPRSVKIDLLRRWGNCYLRGHDYNGAETTGEGTSDRYPVAGGSHLWYPSPKARSLGNLLWTSKLSFENPGLYVCLRNVLVLPNRVERLGSSRPAGFTSEFELLTSFFDPWSSTLKLKGAVHRIYVRGIGS